MFTQPKNLSWVNIQFNLRMYVGSFIWPNVEQKHNPIAAGCLIIVLWINFNAILAIKLTILLQLVAIQLYVESLNLFFLQCSFMSTSRFNTFLSFLFHLQLTREASWEQVLIYNCNLAKIKKQCNGTKPTTQS
jgi:hypothetical protein